MADPRTALQAFIEAYAVADVARMRHHLADDFVGFITNPEGGADRVEGPDAYLARLPELTHADVSLRITQAVEVSPDQALTMVEVRATRFGRELHNYGAFLSRSDEQGRMHELWMVDALPEYSAEFWS